MSSIIFKVKKAGLMTTFQDYGRYGYQRYGVVTSGAMDRYSFQMANLLVGNPLNSASIEISILGPTLELTSNATFAICGANLSPTLNGNSIESWKTFKGKAGDILTFGKQLEGNYAYIAVSGGFDTEEWLGSRSTYAKAKIGRQIFDGELLRGNPRLLKYNRSIKPLSFSNEIILRYIPGPHLDYFSHDSIKCFEEQSFLFMQGDRMGSRLKATNALSLLSTNQLPSDPIPLGAIQVPPNGEPIILLADRQTTGGYPRIGTVISSDIPKLAQLKLGGKIRFERISIEKAQLLYRQKHNHITVLSKLTRL